ncbi:unnamed protein product [Eruca vesicaria subsp. sativa]|uniref:Brix domain-containing protein n=1 Tax=Eruca vesicaria subsp. sativa TaxID=29727 RepID=A0ABC8LZR2_ERUVS|nr:unnamed protein product [Eruca vesicaria subsp. sativa]
MVPAYFHLPPLSLKLASSHPHPLLGLYRHLMLNIVSLLPHCKKDSKVEAKSSKGATLNELVELKGSSSCLFFECRKHKDLYMWMVKSPSGPSVKFLVNAVHTMEELKLTGNHLKGSRPLLTFSSNFDKDVHWKLLKETLTHVQTGLSKKGK